MFLFRSPLSKHALDALEVILGQRAAQLLLGQPLEVDQVVQVVLEVGLAGHDAALEEEDLLALLEQGAVLLAEDGAGDVVRDGHAADDPSVHVDACGLG